MDSLLRFWLKARKQLSKIMLFVFVALAVVIGYLYLQEQNITAPAAVEPAVWNPPEVIESGGVIDDLLTTYTSPLRPFDQTAQGILIWRNAWEVREGQSKEELQREAYALFTEARKAYNQGELDRALALSNQAVAKDPEFTENNKLRTQILQDINTRQAATESPSPQ